MNETPTQRAVRLIQEDARAELFSDYEKELLMDLVQTEIQAVKSNSTVYGGPTVQARVLETLQEIAAKLS